MFIRITVFFCVVVVVVVVVLHSGWHYRKLKLNVITFYKWQLHKYLYINVCIHILVVGIRYIVWFHLYSSFIAIHAAHTRAQLQPD